MRDTKTPFYWYSRKKHRKELIFVINSHINITLVILLSITLIKYTKKVEKVQKLYNKYHFYGTLRIEMLYWTSEINVDYVVTLSK